MSELERLSRALTGQDPHSAAVKKLHASVQGIVDSLSEERQCTPEAFARAQQAVAPLLAQYQRMFAASAERLAGRRAKPDRRAAARSRVKQLVAMRLGHDGVAKVILEFIGLGWDELLVQTWLNEGEQGRNFPLLLTVVERLCDWFHPNAGFPPAPVGALRGALGAIRKGYAAMPRQPAEQARLVKFLELALLSDAGVFDQLRHARFGPKAAVQMLMPGTPIRGPLDDFQRAAFDHWRDAIEALTAGDWLVQRLPDGQTRPLILTYSGERRDICWWTARG